MRIVVMTDSHANLPALKAALACIRRDGCDAIFHTGDALAIGPYPAECLDLLLNTPGIHFLKGNHDSYFADGIPEPRPEDMTEGELQHQLWTHDQLDPNLRPTLAAWPFAVVEKFAGTEVFFTHYALDASGRDFKPVVKHAKGAQLDDLFAPQTAVLVCYGHIHSQSDVQGKVRYLNPGSLGCFDKPLARYCTLDFRAGGYTLEHHSVPYDDGELRRAFAERAVPEREFISRVFFGGRL